VCKVGQQERNDFSVVVRDHVPVGPVRKADVEPLEVAIRVSQVEDLDGAEVGQQETSDFAHVCPLSATAAVARNHAPVGPVRKAATKPLEVAIRVSQAEDLDGDEVGQQETSGSSKI